MIHKSVKGTLVALALFVSSGSLCAAEILERIGVYDSSKCVMETKYGQEEINNVKAVETQLQKAVDDIRQQLVDTEGQLRNTDLLDSLSPDAIAALKTKAQNLSQELERYLNQSAQIMQQAQMNFQHNMIEKINIASKAVAARSNFRKMAPLEGFSYVHADDDVTQQIIAEMESNFEKDKKKLDK